MVGRKIVYTSHAKSLLTQILEFYNERNKSNTYSKKLLRQLKNIILLLITNPELGILIEDFRNIRVLIKGNFKIFYQIKETTIEIISVWDCRQNPDKLII